MKAGVSVSSARRVEWGFGRSRTIYCTIDCKYWVLLQHRFQSRSYMLPTDKEFANLAFFDADFSNFIEGTKFEYDDDNTRHMVELQRIRRR